MSKDCINVYIPSWIPCSEQEDYIKPLFDKDKLIYFNWNYNIIKSENDIGDLLKELTNQLTSFLASLDKYKKKINIFVSSFSQFIFMHIFEQFESTFNQITLLNMFNDLMYVKTISMKKNILPLSNYDAIYKYMYLCESLNNVRNDEKWRKLIHKEVKLINNNDMIIHKLFDQTLIMKNVKYYLLWIKANAQKINVIIGNKNPFINIKKNKLTFLKKIDIIDNAGFCLWIEEPTKLKQIVQEIIKNKR